MSFSFFYRSFFYGFFSVLFLLSFSTTYGSEYIKQATYYSDSFQGGGTANGDRFDQMFYSAAMCEHPLGHYLYVSKGGTGVVVDLNDRPNCAKNSNIIDLSTEAFRQFAPLSVGRIQDVSIASLGESPTEQPKTFLKRDTFTHLGVELLSSIPTVLFSGDSIEISGKVRTNDAYVLLYIQREGSPSVSSLVKVGKDKTFKGYLTLPNVTGEAVFVVASGNSFDTDKYATLSLISRSSLNYPKLPEKARTKIQPKISYSSHGDPLIRLPIGVYGDIEIRQGKRVYKGAGKNLLLKDIPLTYGKAHVKITGYGLSTESPLDRNIFYPSLYSGTVLLERSHDTIGGDSVFVQINNNIAKFRFKTPTSYRVRNKYYITGPNGAVKEFYFPRSFATTEGFLKPGIIMSGSIVLDGIGTSLLEIVREDGIAFANIPITSGNAWPIIDVLKQEEITTIRFDRAQVVRTTIDRINELRNGIGRYSLKQDADLMRLAQAKVNDMIERKYQGHMDPDGNYIDSLAGKIGISPNGSLGENIGYGTVSDLSLQDGLEESGVHRLNMFQEIWTKVGIGYGVEDGKVYLVHIFGE